MTDRNRKPVRCSPYPTLRKVGPYPFQTLQLPECEHDLFDSVAQEHVNIAGTEIDYYSHQYLKSPKDPLYDEPIKRIYTGPFRMKGFAVWPDDTPDIKMEGWRSIINSEIWIPRLTIEQAKCPVPNETDVIQIWDTPYYEEWATQGPLIEGAGYYFDVLNVNDDGHLFDSARFTGFKMLIKRRSDFTPERRIHNE